MVSKWQTLQLGEVCDFQAGTAFPKDYQGEMSGDYPFIKVSDMNLPGNERMIRYANNWINEETREELRAKSHAKGATVFAKIGVALTYNRRRLLEQSTIIDNNMMSATPRETIIDPLFLYYLLRILDFNEIVAGTALPYINMNDLEKISVNIPSLPEQRAIAAILGALDDKIELNRQMNQTLEAMAKALFKSWFVDFEPFRDQGMEESKLGSIPRGWQVGVLRDVVNRIESGSRPRGGVKEIVEGIPSIGAENILGLGRYDYSKTKLVPIDFFENMQDGIVHRGDVLLYKDGAQLGRKSYFDDGFPFDECCVNEHVFMIRTNDLVTQRYLYFWLDQPWMTEEIINLNSNSAQPGINRTSLATLTILIPAVQVIERFDKVVSSLTKHIFVNAKESRTLATIRDTLLPKLLSGEIRVKDAEKFVESKI